MSRVLPRLSSASWARALMLPREVRGISSAKVSWKAPTSTTPSSTMEARASSRERTRTAKGMALAWMLETRGGLNRIRAVASAPGKSESVEGSTMAQPAESPRTSRVNWSTTVPELRTRISQDVSPPGWTVAAFVVRVAVAPMCRQS